MKLRLSVLAIALAINSALPVYADNTAPAGGDMVIAPRITELKVIDTKVGVGRGVTGGNTVTVHYSGWIYRPRADKQHGELFDSSVGGQPFVFPLGQGQVIKGWDQGLVGMKVGGKRTLIIPSSLAYGDAGSGAKIPPGATLIFDVELLDAR